MRYSVDTRVGAEEVYKQAEAYFGPKGAGLELKEGTPGCCAHFESDLGFVHIDIREEEKKTEVELTTREFDIQVREFMKKIA